MSQFDATGPSHVGRGVPSVVTPDAVGLELPTATVGSRGIAYLLDLLILALGFVVIGIASAVLGGGGFVDGWLGIAILLLLLFAWQFGYPILFEVGTRGRTPGKMAMGLRVVTVEGAPVGFRHAAIRAVVGLLELLLTVGAVAVVTSLVNRRGQRLGDLAAGTMVVRERRIGGAPSAVNFAPPPGLEDYTARLDTSAVGADAYATVRDTLVRAPSLPPTDRHRVTTMLATRLAPRLTPPPPAGIPAEVWLWCVAAAVQRRRAGGIAPTVQRQHSQQGQQPVGAPGTYPPPGFVEPQPPSPHVTDRATPGGDGSTPSDQPAPDRGFSPPA